MQKRSSVSFQWSTDGRDNMADSNNGCEYLNASGGGNCVNFGLLLLELRSAIDNGLIAIDNGMNTKTGGWASKWQHGNIYGGKCYASGTLRQW